MPGGLETRARRGLRNAGYRIQTRGSPKAIERPPFLGGKLLITHLGVDYVSRMFRTYAGRVPAEADLVCYWFEKAGRQIASDKAARSGLGSSRRTRSGVV